MGLAPGGRSRLGNLQFFVSGQQFLMQRELAEAQVASLQTEESLLGGNVSPDPLHSTGSVHALEGGTVLAGLSLLREV